MLWIDYREKLGIAFCDYEKFELLQSKINNVLNVVGKEIPYDDKSFFPFCMMVGIQYQKTFEPIQKVADLLSKCHEMEEFLSYYMAFVNTFVESEFFEWGSRGVLLNVLKNNMYDTKIGYEIQNDIEQNCYFVFPKGVPEFDNALVSDTLEWLKAYPKSQKMFIIGLKQYADGEYTRDIADNFRKALEDFLKEFFTNTKNLSNNIKVVGEYIKKQGGDSEITKILVNIMSCYDTLNNKIAKHNDNVDEKFLEFLLYQTGIFIRMLIVIRNAEEKLKEL